MFPVVIREIAAQGRLRVGDPRSVHQVLWAACHGMTTLMIAKPDLIMLDEPSEGIMPVLVDEMFELFRSMKAQGTTILLVEQNVELALEIADRAYVLDQGAVVYHAPASVLLADDDVKERYCSV